MESAAPQELAAKATSEEGRAKTKTPQAGDRNAKGNSTKAIMVVYDGLLGVTTTIYGDLLWFMMVYLGLLTTND